MFAVAVEVAVVVGGELRIRAQLAGEHTAGQRGTRQNAHAFFFGLGKKSVRRLLPEAIKNDLHRLHVGIFDGLERLFHLLHAHAVVADLPCLDQIVEHAKNFGAIVEFGRRTVQLHQIKRVGGEIFQAAVDPRIQIFAAVTFDSLLGQAASSFGGDDDFVFTIAPARFLELSDKALAASVTVNVGGVNEVDARVDGLVQRGKRFIVRDIAPHASNGPRAKTDVRNFPGYAAQGTVVHDLVSPKVNFN